MKLHLLHSTSNNDPYLDSLFEFQASFNTGGNLYITNGPWDKTDISGSIIYYITSNPFTTDLESYVYNKPHTHKWLLDATNASRIKQIWLPDHYKEYKSYVETIYKKPVVCIPYIYKIPDSLAPSYTPDTLIDIVLFDTNDTFNNSVLKPLYICEELYRRSPSNLGTVYLLNMPENDTAYKLIESFRLRQDKKLRIFKGLREDQVFSFFCRNKHRTVFLSNSVLPEITPFMNTIVYSQLLLLHTQKEFPFGVYYEMNDIETCLRFLGDYTLKNTIGLTMSENEKSKQFIIDRINHLSVENE
jgi:hypothetical protein